MGLEKSWNSDVGTATLNPQPVFPELYNELWWHSGGYASGTTGVFMQKGTTSLNSGTPISQNTLFTTPSNWNVNTQVALEVSAFTSSSVTSFTLNLYDLTGGGSSIVSGSTINVNATTMTVIRSGKFTLSQGRTYGIGVSGTSNNPTTYVTDASLIIFPPAPLTSPSVSSISLANPSGNTLRESYVPLWVMSSGTASTTNTSLTSYLWKGQTTLGGNSSPSELYTLSSSWHSSQKFALEVSMHSSSSSYTVNAALVQVANGQIVISNSQISTTATSSTLLRSNSFTLTSGIPYGVALNTSGGTAYLSKAHLVALAP